MVWSCQKVTIGTMVWDRQLISELTVPTRPFAMRERKICTLLRPLSSLCSKSLSCQNGSKKMLSKLHFKISRWMAKKWKVMSVEYQTLHIVKQVRLHSLEQISTKVLKIISTVNPWMKGFGNSCPQSLNGRNRKASRSINSNTSLPAQSTDLAVRSILSALTRRVRK